MTGPILERFALPDGVVFATIEENADHSFTVVFYGQEERITPTLTPYDSGGFVQEPISDHGELTHDQARAMVEEYRKALLSGND
jgi:hypothetical protein